MQLYLTFARFPSIQTSVENGEHLVEFSEDRFVNGRRGARSPFTYLVVFDAAGNLIEQGFQTNAMSLREIERTPSEISGRQPVRILIFSDTHGDIRSLDRIVAQPADIYIAAGDLSTFRKKLDRCGEALKPLGEKLWLLPGNHESHEDTLALCHRYGFVDFHRQVRIVESSQGNNALGRPRL